MDGSYSTKEGENRRIRYTLDETIDRDKVDAVMKNGILTLHLKESSKPRKIEIKAR